MLDRTEEFLKKCAENKKKLIEKESYSSPTITALDAGYMAETRGGSATSTTTTGAAVAAGVSAVF